MSSPRKRKAGKQIASQNIQGLKYFDKLMPLLSPTSPRRSTRVQQVQDGLHNKTKSKTVYRLPTKSKTVYRLQSHSAAQGSRRRDRRR